MNPEPQPEKEKPFDISIWRRSFIEKNDQMERNRLEQLNKVWKAVDRLALKYEWGALYLFGSITRKNCFHQHSDVDIGIQGLDKLLHFRFISDLSELVDKDVDVILMEECSFAETIKKRGVRWKKQK